MSNEIEIHVKGKDESKAAFASGEKNAAAFGDGVAKSSESASTSLAKMAIITGGVSEAVESAGGIFTDFVSIQQEAQDQATEHAQALQDVEQAEQDADQATRDLEQATLDLTQAQRDGKQAALDIKQAHVDEKQAALDVAVAKRDLAETIKEYGKGSLEARQAALDLTQAEHDQKQATADAAQARIDKKQATQDAKQAEEDATQATLDSKQATLDETSAKIEASRTTSGLATVIGTATTVISSAVSAIGLATMAHTGLTSSTLVSTVATKAATLAQKALNLAMRMNPIGLVVTAVMLLVGALVVAYQKSETFRKIVNGAFRAVQKGASVAFNWVKDNWPLLLAILTGPFGLAVLVILKNKNKIVGFFKSVPGAIKGAFKGLGSAITAPFTSAFDAIKSLWNSTVGGFGFSIPSWVPKVGGNSFRIPEMAHGGIAGGLVSVGERGRELVRLPYGSTVIPNGQTEAMMADGSGRRGAGAQPTVPAGKEIDYARMTEAFIAALMRVPIVRLADAGQGAYQAGASI